MSKKMPEHKRLFKLWKSGYFNKIQIEDEELATLKVHYPRFFPNS